MIKVVAKMFVKADKVDELVKIAKELVAASRQDAGNIGYTFNVSVEDPLQFAMIENWKDKESLDAHMKTEHFLKGMKDMADCLAGEGSIELFREV